MRSNGKLINKIPFFLFNNKKKTIFLLLLLLLLESLLKWSVCKLANVPMRCYISIWRGSDNNNNDYNEPFKRYTIAPLRLAVEFKKNQDCVFPCSTLVIDIA